MPDDAAMLALIDYGFDCWEESGLVTYLKRVNMDMAGEVEWPKPCVDNASKWVARARQLKELLGGQCRFKSLVDDLVEKAELYWAFFPLADRPLPEETRTEQKQIARDFHTVFRLAEQVYGQHAAQKARAARQGTGLKG